MPHETTTYEQVGKVVGLEGYRLYLYISYMRTRWPHHELSFCFGSLYAKEWAERFKEGTEFVYADSEGERILKALLTGVTPLYVTQ